jgi:hypothetical protein
MSDGRSAGCEGYLGIMSGRWPIVRQLGQWKMCLGFTKICESSMAVHFDFLGYLADDVGVGNGAYVY